jgi:hypothetical protein
MYSSPQKLSQGAVLELRRQAGRWLRELREARGLSQRRLADRVGAEYYTFISQLNRVEAVFHRTDIRRGRRHSESAQGFLSRR